MDIISFASSLSLDKIVETTKQNLGCSVGIYYGKILEDTVIDQQNDKVELIMNTVGEKICKTIRAKWNAIENISIVQRSNDENIVICASSNDKNLCLTAVTYAVEVFNELWQDCKEQKETKDNLMNPPKPSDLYGNSEDNDVQIPYHMVQIQATTDQINKRIDSFIERKREQVNLSNIKDFCKSGEVGTCARVDGVLCRRKDSKSHIQVRRVVNDCGPQIATLPTKKESYQQCEEGQNSVADKFPPSKTIPLDTVPKGEKPFRIKKRTFSSADIESKLEILKRRVVP